MSSSSSETRTTYKITTIAFVTAPNMEAALDLYDNAIAAAIEAEPDVGFSTTVAEVADAR